MNDEYVSAAAAANILSIFFVIFEHIATAGHGWHIAWRKLVYLCCSVPGGWIAIATLYYAGFGIMKDDKTLQWILPIKIFLTTLHVLILLYDNERYTNWIIMLQRALFDSEGSRRFFFHN